MKELIIGIREMERGGIDFDCMAFGATLVWAWDLFESFASYTHFFCLLVSFVPCEGYYR